METIKLRGYKVFNPDLTCKGFKFEIGKSYHHEGKIKICYSGFHFCLSAAHCFSYYSFDPKNIVCEVEGSGKIETRQEDSKICASDIEIIRQLTWDEVLKVANQGKDNTGHSNSGDWNSGYRNSGDCNSGDSNSGDWNSGDWNSGYRNSGDRNSGYRNSGNRNSGYRNSGYRNSGDRNSGNCNSGYRNSGDRNSGDCNSGDRNSGDWNSGYRNSGDCNSGYRNSGAFCLDKNPKVWLFDKPTEISMKEWEQSQAINIMTRLLEIEIWVESFQMSDDEKKANPKHETIGGYLKHKTLKEAWKDMWGNLKEDEKKVFSDLPNFDSNIFFEITGIKL